MADEPINVNDIINLLDEVRSNSSYEVITTKKEKLKFFPMSAEDQKTLIKVLIDSPLYNSKFSVSMYDILNNTYAGEEVFMEKPLSILDRDIILIKSRIENVGDSFSIKTESKEDVSISLENHLKSLKISPPKDSKISVGDITVVLNYPTILEDFKLEKHLESIIDITTSKEKSGQAEIKGIISNIFIINIIKYIRSVKIKDSEINYSSLSVADKMKITQKLNNIVIRKITEEIDSVFSKPLIDIKTIKYTDSGEEKSHLLELDNSFFVA